MELTKEQRAAVETTAHEAVVIAGAGSGKTRVLTARVCHLLASGVSPDEIMVLTFTRKAAGEMRERLEGQLRAKTSRSVQRIIGQLLLGTFHAVGLHLLRSHGRRIGYDPESLTVADEADADMLLWDSCERMGLVRHRKWRANLSWKQAQQFRQRYYETGRRDSESEGAGLLGSALDHYHAELRSMNTLDFGLILLETNRLLSDHAVRNFWRDRIRHVLIDEVQDCDEVQYVLHDHFSPPATFFAVGDPRQCIYSWRGARPDLMLKSRPQAAIYQLQECFRCDIAIVRAANRLIDHNAEIMAKPMRCGMLTRPGYVARFPGRSADVADAVIDIAHRSTGNPIRWGDLAVLARKHSALRSLSEILEEKGVPHYQVGSGLSVCQTETFRVLHAALRFALNPRDRLAHKRLSMAFGASGIAETVDDNGKPYSGSTQFEQLGEQMEAAVRAGVIIGDCLPGMLPYLPGESAMYGPAFEYWHEQCCELTIEEALRWHALRDVQDDLTEGNRVTLATIHAAKGLEWPIVFVVDMNEGHLPSALSLREPEGVFDERRVCYVALTRSKSHLLMHWRRPQDQSRDRRVVGPSRFLEEAGYGAAISERETVAHGSGAQSQM